MILASAIRRRNEVAHRIDAARLNRRRAAKAKHAPKPSKPTMNPDKWQHPGKTRKDK